MTPVTPAGGSTAETLPGTPPDELRSAETIAVTSAETAGVTMDDAGATVISPTAQLTPLTLSVGHDFGTRYHIIRVLGKGGMGAVYQAWDKVLEVAVAIKVIRPDATMDPEAARALEKRFKRELLLARQVTHKNVVRIHDLGEIDGITYITMPYVQGSDLATILKREGRLPLDRALAVARHVAAGLAAAHDAGVIHRDLKPANIMLDADDDALIMDFGIARSTSSTGVGMTVAGAVVGTVEYMAPEQAQGGAVDQRVDIYAFGLILHDMLVGRRQVSGSSAISDLMQRMREAPAPVRTVDASIPEWLDQLITRCLQPDPADRFQSMHEVLALLQPAERGGTVAYTAFTTPAAAKVPSRWISRVPWPLAAAVLVILLAGGGYFAWTRLSTPPPLPSEPTVATGPAVSLAVLPFRNASGDSTLDRVSTSLDQVLVTMLGESSQVRTVPQLRVNQVLRDLRIAANASLTPVELAQVADFTNTRHVLWGQVTRFGDTIRIDATLQNLDLNQIENLSASAPGEEAVLTAISQLAADIQRRLARGSSDVLGELKATAWRPSTQSFEALRLYNAGLAYTQQGQHQEALKSYQAAVNADGSFALALSALAQSYAVQGYGNEAAQYSRQALALSDNLPPPEKYRIAAAHYSIVNDIERAIESYEAIVKASPGDVLIRYTLAGLYEQRGALDQARQHFAAIVESDPKFGDALLGLGRVEIRRGQPQDALQYLNSANTLAIELNNRPLRANVLQAIGIAHSRLSRHTEALQHFEQSLQIKKEIGDQRGMAASLVQIGEVQRALGKPDAAEQSYREALKLRRGINDRPGISLTLMDLGAVLAESGRSGEALPLMKEALTILQQLGDQNLQARALSNIGALYMADGKYSEAEIYLERAVNLREKIKAAPREAADTLHNLGETLTMMGRYEQALQRFARALELRRASGDRRSEAIEHFGIGGILDHQGRFGAAASAKQEAVKVFQDLGLRDVFLSDLLGGYGRSLALSGRPADAVPILEQALTLATELKSSQSIARTLRFQAERAYYAGDLTAAQRLAGEAEQAAARTSNRSLVLEAQVVATTIAAASRPTRQVVARFNALAKEAESVGLRALAAECSVHAAHALLRLGDRAAAEQQAARAITSAESLGLRLTQAKAHYVRAAALDAGRSAEARREFAIAVRLFEQIRNDTDNAQVLERSDLAPIYAESRKGAGA